MWTVSVIQHTYTVKLSPELEANNTIQLSSMAIKNNGTVIKKLEQYKIIFVLI